MSFLDKLKEGASKAADKAKDTVEITKLNTQISSKRKEIEKLYNHIGEIVFQAYTAKDFMAAQPEIEQNCSLVVDLHQEIDGLEQRIKIVKNEKDCVCGHVVALDIRFCPKCGHKFETEEPVAVEAPAVEVTLCSSCGKEVEPSDKFCGHCGATNS